MGEMAYGPGEAEARAAAFVCYTTLGGVTVTNADSLSALITAARSEGARQERERIRGLELDENVRGLLKGVMHAIHHTPWSASAWRALLAAITQVSEANTHGGAAVTEGE